MAATRFSGWRKHLDGWQAGAMLLLIAGGAILLAVPRAVAPSDIPPPRVDRAVLQQQMADDDAMAQSVTHKPLDVDTRRVGTAFRRYNVAAAHSRPREMQDARRDMARAITTALSRIPDELLVLRAYEMHHFVSAVRAWEQTGTVSDELEALGGDFPRMVRRNGWCRADGRRLAMDDAVLRAFFKRRWNELTGLKGGLFALTVDEERSRFGYLIERPFVGDRDAALVQHGKELPVRKWQSQLRMIDGLAQRDPAYAADLARGVVFYRMGRYGFASDAFRRHLNTRPDGPYTLRARNHLKAALEAARASGG